MQNPRRPADPAQANPAEELFRAKQEEHDPDHFLHELDDALASLPLAAILGAALALRPRRKGTPPRQASVIQTQIILASVGDPKDAVVMLCCLGVGLASGVGLYALARVSTVFLMVVLFLLESFEPESKKLFDVTIKSKKDIREQVEQIFRRASIDYELRSVSEEEHVYEVRIPIRRRTDRISTAIVALDSSNEIAVEWKEKKPAKPA